MMSFTPLDITQLRGMLEAWDREPYFHCVGVMRSFGF